MLSDLLRTIKATFKLRCEELLRPSLDLWQVMHCLLSNYRSPSSSVTDLLLFARFSFNSFSRFSLAQFRDSSSTIIVIVALSSPETLISFGWFCRSKSTARSIVPRCNLACHLFRFFRAVLTTCRTANTSPPSVDRTGWLGVTVYVIFMLAP